MHRLAPCLAAVLALAAAACGTDGAGKPMSTKTFGGDRPADLKTPATLTADKQYPLVVLLHGFGATGFAQQAYLGMQGLTAADAALWIAPDGTTNAGGMQFWNAGPECCDFGNQNPDDVGYLTTLVEDIVAEWPIDESRIFFIGHSNGGYMSYRMAIERADLIAGVMSLAGNVPSSTQMPASDVSVLHLHGTLDGTVPFSAGNTGANPAVMTWAANNGCGTTRAATVTLDLDTQVAGSETTGERFEGCPTGVDVELWTMTGSGHIPVVVDAFATTVFDWLAARPKR